MWPTPTLWIEQTFMQQHVYDHHRQSRRLLAITLSIVPLEFPPMAGHSHKELV